ncbi:MAG TPA: hypothetical protein PKW50_01095 [Syntrophomonas sp.]|nr:hypothetical protein [Syntrophomonas sp.]
MKKHIPVVFLALFLCLFFSPVALAAANWQVDWKENGALQEKVVVSGQDLNNVDSSWQRTATGNEIVFNRSVENWEAYNKLTDKLPVQATVKNLFFCNIITLTALPQIQNNNTLYSSFDQSQTLRLEMNVPGIILDSSTSQRNGNIVYWDIKNPGNSFDQGFTFQTIMVDGLGLGITILLIGAVILAIIFAARMRKVNRIIDETYSLDNIVIDDEEDDR